ncbi:hypothetical protein BLA29_009836 [Euroglyphus maynei]|uniref:Uncharacterized protein n=1 Tax=Euroglyphus maynei TaxID=6958 RepID=A0A1Y3BG86_EURMA|nr:hypothetical protein BLA29_009836 [Euroglyphus maynei]
MLQNNIVLYKIIMVINPENGRFDARNIINVCKRRLNGMKIGANFIPNAIVSCSFESSDENDDEWET